MVLKTCCFSDALCPLLLNPTVTLTDPLVTGHWSLVHCLSFPKFSQILWSFFRACVTAVSLVPGAHFDSTGPVRPPSF